MIINEVTKRLSDLGMDKNRIEDFTDEKGRTFPCYQLSEFINTLYGNNLHAECLKNHDMRLYYEARAAYYREHPNAV